MVANAVAPPKVGSRKRGREARVISVGFRCRGDTWLFHREGSGGFGIRDGPPERTLPEGDADCGN